MCGLSFFHHNVSSDHGLDGLSGLTYRAKKFIQGSEVGEGFCYTFTR